MSPRFEPYDVAIAGAGISGLTCASALKRVGLRAIVLEADATVGGCIKTIRRDGCIADGGPQTFSSMPAFVDLVQSAGVDSALQRARCAASMYFYSHGALSAVPTSPGTFLATPLLSPLAKLRLLAEPFIGARVSESDESLADFAARRCGRAVVDALVKPMVGGIFAGDPARLSASSTFPSLVDAERRYTSVLIGVIARRMERSTSGAVDLHGRPFINRHDHANRRSPLNFAGGNDSLVHALASHLDPDVRLDSPVTDLILRGANIELGFGGSQPGSVVARHAVLALPADVSGALLLNLEPEAAAALHAIAYVPIAQIALTYPRTAVDARLDGFGFLSGERSGLRILGCSWNSSMFADRCPPDSVLVTAFLGGAGDQEIATLSDDALVRIAHDDLRRALGIGAIAPTVIAGFRWERAIPQFEVGHAQRLATVAAGLSRLPQVTLAGNYLKGPSITDCIGVANDIAEKVASRLK